MEWDAASDMSAGDYFSQERAMIADQARMGHISTDQAAELARVLFRIQRSASGDAAARVATGRVSQAASERCGRTGACPRHARYDCHRNSR